MGWEALCPTSATRAYLGITAQRELSVVVPPPSEQRLIIEALLPKVDKLDAGAESISAQIERLQEYRKALITAAVTGQLHIGEAA